QLFIAQREHALNGAPSVLVRALVYAVLLVALNMVLVLFAVPLFGSAMIHALVALVLAIGTGLIDVKELRAALAR
ncbi:MAG TPA: hypothetical protein PK760_02390, partial [Flavobacteriales bacterium]|nr:hypothetical protein [Flavobacteriales bacterium]